MFSKEAIALAKATVEAIKKIAGKWEWKPEEGEWCIFRKKLFLVQRTHFISPIILLYLSDNYYNHPTWKQIKSVIPLLHWERIEKILEGLGYMFAVTEFDDPFEYACTIEKPGGKSIQKYSDETRQLAVMRAVIELGKEK